MRRMQTRLLPRAAAPIAGRLPWFWRSSLSHLSLLASRFPGSSFHAVAPPSHRPKRRPTIHQPSLFTFPACSCACRPCQRTFGTYRISGGDRGPSPASWFCAAVFLPHTSHFCRHHRTHLPRCSAALTFIPARASAYRDASLAAPLLACLPGSLHKGNGLAGEWSTLSVSRQGEGANRAPMSESSHEARRNQGGRRMRRQMVSPSGRKAAVVGQREEMQR